MVGIMSGGGPGINEKEHRMGQDCIWDQARAAEHQARRLYLKRWSPLGCTVLSEGKDGIAGDNKGWPWKILNGWGYRWDE